MERPPKLYRAFNFLFALFFVILVLLSIFRHNNPFLTLGRPQLLLVTVLAAAAFCAASYAWGRWGRAPRHEMRTACLLLGIYFLLLLCFGLPLQVRMGESWDFTTVTAAARDLVLDGTPPGEYFVYCANNAPLLWLYVGLFSFLHLLGIQELMTGLVVFNCLCITLSLLFLYLIARCLWGGKWAVFALLYAFTCPALWLYAPIAYTDTLSMPLATASLWLWLIARQRAHSGSGRHTAAVLASLGLAALGGVLRMTVMILPIAYFLDFLLCRFWHPHWRASALGLAACLLLFWGGSHAARAALPEYDVVPMPMTHWVMMGLRGDGGYNDIDFHLSEQFSTYPERKAFIQHEICRRLASMGPLGFLQHCADKLCFTVSDGTYFAASKLDRLPRWPNVLHKFIIAGEPYSGFLYYAADAWQLCLLTLCAVGAVRAVRRPELGMTVARAAVFGLLLFLLIWETRSRYLVNFLPLLLLCAASGYVPDKAGAPPASEK